MATLNWKNWLQCPRCGASLSGVDFQEPRCHQCGLALSVSGRALIFDPSIRQCPGLDSEDGRAMAAAYRRPRPLLRRLRRVVTSEYFPGESWRAAKRAVLEKPPFLVIGSGVTRYQGGVHLDIDDFPGVDVVADAHKLPFQGDCFNGVICEVVLEHVAAPELVIAEAFRVLKPGGVAFFIVPFLFPFHGHPADFHRWSRQGLQQDFQAFAELEIGIHGGPCSAMVNLLSEWAYVLSGLAYPKGYTLIKGAATALLFPIKFLDFWAHRFSEAHRLASTLYVKALK